MQGTTTGDKNEILWQHNINYQTLPEQFKKASGSAHMQALTSLSLPCFPCMHSLLSVCAAKQGGSVHDDVNTAVGVRQFCYQSPALQGTVIVRRKQAQVVKERADGTPVERQVSRVVLQHVDIITESFWDMHPDILK